MSDSFEDKFVLSSFGFVGIFGGILMIHWAFPIISLLSSLLSLLLGFVSIYYGLLAAYRAGDKKQ